MAIDGRHFQTHSRFLLYYSYGSWWPLWGNQSRLCLQLNLLFWNNFIYRKFVKVVQRLLHTLPPVLSNLPYLWYITVFDTLISNKLQTLFGFYPFPHKCLFFPASLFFFFALGSNPVLDIPLHLLQIFHCIRILLLNAGEI